MADTRKGLLVSIHDVSPRSERPVELLLEQLGRLIDPSKVAMLVVPISGMKLR
jgi:acetolactate synthase regulatory subunit